jgi:hypothetical protein
MSRSSATWTPEKAREMAVKGLETRRRNALLRQFQPKIDALASLSTPDDVYSSSLLARVRAQVTGLLDHIDRETRKCRPNGQKINWLASALERIAELERRLAGRPMPGTMRPGTTAKREVPRSTSAEPVNGNGHAAPAPRPVKTSSEIEPEEDQDQLPGS